MVIRSEAPQEIVYPFDTYLLLYFEELGAILKSYSILLNGYFRANPISQVYPEERTDTLIFFASNTKEAFVIVGEVSATE
jgi:hypothetical protein